MSKPSEKDAIPTLHSAVAGYSKLSRVIHWSTAALVMILIAMGLYSLRLPLDTQPREDWLLVHKSLGVIALVLSLIQLTWVQAAPPRVDNSKLRSWEVLASRVGHVLLYAILILMPLSGMLMSQGSGREVGMFNLFNIPQILPLEPGVPARQQHYYKLGKYLHDVVFQWALYAIIVGHLAGVIKHQFIDGDRTFVRRMWGFSK